MSTPLFYDVDADYSLKTFHIFLTTIVCIMLTPYIGFAVFSLRTKNNLSQEELAERSGLHRTYISLVERGKRIPTIDALERITNAMNVDIFELITIAKQTAEKKND